MTDPRLTLEARIQAEIKSYDGKLGLYINDMRGNVITMNPDEPYETASTIKVYILAALYMAIEAGKASLKDKLVCEERFWIDGSGILGSLEVGTELSVKNVATLMIIVSDNIATNMLIDYLGIDYINDCIAALGCTGTKLHNVLDFAKYHQLGTTTPRDYASMFERILQGTLVSPQASQEMWDILKQQHYNSMLVKSLPQYYVDPDNYDEQIFTFASKSGSMNACRNDGGIITTPYGSYVIVMLHKEFSDKQYYPDHPATVYGSRVHRLIFDQYLALEGRLK
jgi:beta-lactamase class A